MGGRPGKPFAGDARALVEIQFGIRRAAPQPEAEGADGAGDDLGPVVLGNGKGVHAAGRRAAEVDHHVRPPQVRLPADLAGPQLAQFAGVVRQGNRGAVLALHGAVGLVDDDQIHCRLPHRAVSVDDPFRAEGVNRT